MILSSNKIAKIININDFPDNNRKLHKEIVPLIGGVIVFLNITLLFLIQIFLNDKLILLNENIFTYREIYSFFITSFLLFILGIYDDKYNISPNQKLLLLSFIVYLSLTIDPSLVLVEMRLSFYGEIILFKNADMIITIICFLLFMNAYNMMDGIDLLAGLYAIIIFSYFIVNGIFFLTSIFMLFSLITFSYLNFNQKTFLGDSGTILVSYVISYIFVKYYNNETILYADSIIIIMLIPGLDLLRLAIERLVNRRNPFKPDRSHFHHLMQSIIKNRIICVSFIILVCIIPFLISIISTNLLAILISSIFYVFLVYLLKSYAK